MHTPPNLLGPPPFGIYPHALPPNITPSSSPSYLALAVSGAHVWAEGLYHPCLLGGPQHGDKKRGKGGTAGKRGGNLARRAQRANVLSKGHTLLAPTSCDSHQTNAPETNSGCQYPQNGNRIMGECLPGALPSPPLAEAPGKSEKRRSDRVPVLGQGGASARRVVPAKPGVTTSVMAENHIKTNSSGLQ